MDELFDKDVVKYTDTEHSVIDGLGDVRFNGISNIFEIINRDEQSGCNVTSATNIQKIWP
jgi:hypothetical protein